MFKLLFIAAFFLLSGCQKVSQYNSEHLDNPLKELISPEIATGFEEKPISVSSKFMAVSAHPLATEAGKKILAEGGSAVDAAIAMQAVLNVVEPQSSGIGGGGFLVHYNAQKHHIISYDGREVAPKNVSKDLFLDGNGNPISFQKASIGGHAVAVPSILKMLMLAHKEQGKLPWAKLFEDAIKIAHNGFALSKRLYFMLKAASHYQNLSKTDFKRYLNADNTIKSIDSIIYNKPLAQTFMQIAQKGPIVFYEGKIAHDIIDTITKNTPNPSKMTLSDLALYQPIKRTVPCITYHQHKVCGMGAPSSGGITVMQALKLLERFNLKDYNFYNPYHIHLTASALRLAYADRNKYLADPNFSAVPTKELLADGYISRRSKHIDPHKAFEKAIAGDPSEGIIQYASLKKSEPPSTTHMSIVDMYGNAVSFTSTVEQAFGSGLVTKSGFILNNQMTDFDFRSEYKGVQIANRIEPFKRPRSSMSPLLIFNSQDKLSGVIGSPGGARIISFVFPRILALIHSKQKINHMLSAPNITAMLQDTKIEIEKHPNSNQLKYELMKYGYKPTIRDLTSGIHMIKIEDNKLYGTADPRREGTASQE